MSNTTYLSKVNKSQMSLPYISSHYKISVNIQMIININPIVYSNRSLWLKYPTWWWCYRLCDNTGLNRPRCQDPDARDTRPRPFSCKAWSPYTDKRWQHACTHSKQKYVIHLLVSMTLLSMLIFTIPYTMIICLGTSTKCVPQQGEESMQLTPVTTRL